MELRHLRYFISVAEHRSIRGAALQLNLTQPGVSRQIQDLEEELGVALFARTARGLNLTEAGAAFLSEAQSILDGVETAVQSVKPESDSPEGHLRIGFVENAGWDGIVPASFNRFQLVAPKVRVELAPRYTLAQLEALRAGVIDGAFVYLFDAPAPDMCVRPLLKHDVVLAVPGAWDFPGGGPVAARSLIGYPFVTFRRQVYPAYYDRLIAACARAGLTLSVAQEVSTEPAILSLVSAGIGAAIVNAANLGRPPVQARFLPLVDISVPLPLSFVHMQSNGNPALRRFIEVVNTEAAKHPSRAAAYSLA